MALPIAVGTTATTFENGEFTVADTAVTLHITRTGSGPADSLATYEHAYKTAAGASSGIESA